MFVKKRKKKKIDQKSSNYIYSFSSFEKSRIYYMDYVVLDILYFTEMSLKWLNVMWKFHIYTSHLQAEYWSAGGFNLVVKVMKVSSIKI